MSSVFACFIRLCTQLTNTHDEPQPCVAASEVDLFYSAAVSRAVELFQFAVQFSALTAVSAASAHE